MGTGVETIGSPGKSAFGLTINVNDHRKGHDHK